MTNMSKKQVFLPQWDYIINCNENDNEKTDHINKTSTDQDPNIETDIRNIACLSKIISILQ